MIQSIYRKRMTGKYKMMVQYTEKYFIIECNGTGDNATGIFKTKQGKEFAKGLTYCVDHNNPRYLSVQDEKGLWTLYDKNGKPVKNAKEVSHVYWDKKGYVVGIRENRKKYIFPEYRLKQVLCGLAITGVLAAVASGIRSCCEKQAEYEQKTQMTYLGISNGVALFDTDGNMRTAEIVADHLTSGDIGRLYGQEGKKYSIAKWKEIVGHHHFVHTY